MIRARLSQVAGALEATLAKGDAGFVGATIDTRALQAGELFVALRGERVDGHDFLDAAHRAGAAAALVERPVAIDLPQLVCANTRDALGALARWWRELSPAMVLGITGSNGKTTVKSLCAGILARAGRCHVNAGNLNNEIGMPLSLLRMAADTEFGVFEMGAGQPGDIAYLAGIAMPHIALVNNVAPAHLARMGSVERVAETKGAIYAALPASGAAVINADDAFARRFEQLAAGRRIIQFGLDRDADVTADIESLGAESRIRIGTPTGRLDVKLPLPGRHNVRNALAATALALAAGVSLDAIAYGLEHGTTAGGRLSRHPLARGATVIDDSYNANPGSVVAAIDTLVLEPGERWLVLGNMAELGADADALHAEVGRYARGAGIDRLYTVGSTSALASAAFGPLARHFQTHEEAVAALRADWREGVTVLVKGSRSSAMERVVQGLLKDGDTPRGAQHAA